MQLQYHVLVLFQLLSQRLDIDFEIHILYPQLDEYTIRYSYAYLF